MADPTATQLDQCDSEMPLLGVTREFDFGQFIELFDSSPNPLQPELPALSRVVIQPNSTLAADRDSLSNDPRVRAASSAAMTAGTAPPLAAEPEVNLFDLAERGPGAKLAPQFVEIKDAAGLFRDGMFEAGGVNYKADLDGAQRDALAMGLAVTVYAMPTEGGTAIPFKLALPFEPVRLSGASLAQLLSGDGLDSPAGAAKPMLTEAAIRALLAGTAVLTHSVDAQGARTPVALLPPSAQQVPMADGFQVFDLPGLIANPAVLAKNGARLPLSLAPQNIEELIGSGHTQLDVGGHTVSLTLIADSHSPDAVAFRDAAAELRDVGGGLPPVKPFGRKWSDIIAAAAALNVNPHFVHPWQADADSGLAPGRAGGRVAAGGGSGAVPESMTAKVQPRLPTGSGLAVAVFVPWKQTWTLKGFSRGNLLSTIALAPSEQVTMQVNSWERRSRSLEQSTEMEADQQTDINQSTRDTEDVFKEMLAKHDFAWQLSGSIDASYSPGVASIKVHAGGGVSDTSSIQQTARNSSQSVRESTIKASSRVRSKRVTRITQTVESGKEERVTRVIRNPNQCHTLTLDFFETLARYEIKLEFQKSRLRLVVLLPNPVKVPSYDSAVVRRNETALRNALIDTALAEGFDACRMAAAYDEAKVLVNAQKSEAVRVEEMETQRAAPKVANAPDPAAPQEAEVVRVATEMVAALKAIRSGAGIDDALKAINAHAPVDEISRRKGQQWLFINFCAAKFPALLHVLDDIAGGAASGIAAAQKIMSVLPRPDAPTNLANLNQMSDHEKEECCIASKLKEENSQHQRLYMKMEWDWNWWSTRLKEESLYSANDGGLGGGADLLQKAYNAWQAKKAQGEAMKDQDQAKTETEGRQDKATADDKLSMAFPLEDLARAYERMKVLFEHMNEHREFYNYALFQALPPTEQALALVEASNGRLQVGMFEPRVVAMSGSRLVVPLTPLAGSVELQAFLTALGTDLEAGFSASLATPDTSILPTPGISISSRLGKCTGCEPYINSARELELTRLEALAKQETLEAQRRQGRIDANNFEDFHERPAVVKLAVDAIAPVEPWPPV